MSQRGQLPAFSRLTVLGLSLAAGSLALLPNLGCSGSSVVGSAKDPAPSISNFSVTPAVVAAGGTAKVNFTANYSGQGATGVITPGNLSITPAVALSVNQPTATTTYTLTVTDTAGRSTTTTTQVEVLGAQDTTITTGGDAAGKVTKGATGLTASVPAGDSRNKFAWSITNGTITGGQGTRSITYTAGTTVGAQVTLTCTVTNAANLASSGTKTLDIIDAVPAGLTYSSNPATYYANVAITPNTPNSTGGAVVSYAVNPALPTGLSLNTTTGVISGTPTAQTAQATYTITATNSGGTATTGLVITVNPQPAVSFTASPATIAPGGGSILSWTIDSSIASVSITDGTTTYGPFTASGTQNVTPAVTKTYTLTATLKAGGTYTPPPVTVSIDTTPLAISTFGANPTIFGGTADLTWTLAGLPLTQTLDGNSIASDARTASVTPYGRQQYTLAVSNGTTNTSATALVAARGVYHVAGSYSAGRGNLDGGVDKNGFSMARFYRPNSISWDEFANDGTMIVCDYSNNLVRRITPDRKVVTIAGTPGLAGVAADNTTLTKLYQPRNSAVDPVTGDVYLGGEGFTTKRLLKLTRNTDGTYTPSAVPGFAYNTNAIVIDANQVMYFITYDTGFLYTMDLKVASPTAVQVANLAAVVGTNAATAMAKDFNGGRRLLYVVGINKILKIDISGATPTATLFAGTGTAGFADHATDAKLGTLNAPQGVAVDTTGNVYIADRNNYAVRMVPAGGPLAGGLVTIAGRTGTATEGYASSAITLGTTLPTSTTACLSNTYYVAVRGNGDVNTQIFVADAGASSDNQAIRLMTVSGTTTGGFPGGGTVYTLDDPAKAPGYAYAGSPRSTGNADGVGVSAKFSMGTTPSANLASLPNGSLSFVADTGNNAVKAIAADGTVTTLKNSSLAAFTFTAPKGVAVQVNGSGALVALFVGDAAATKKIRKFTPNGDGTYTEDTTFAITGGTFPASVDALGLAVDSANGFLYVADATLGRVFKVNAGTGAATDFIASTGTGTRGIALQADGSVWVAVYTANQVKKYDATGTLQLTVGAGTSGFVDGAATSAQFTSPVGIAADTNGFVYVTSYSGSTTSPLSGLRAIKASTGEVSTLLGSAVSTTASQFFGLKPGLQNPNNQNATTQSLLGGNLYAPQGLAINANGDLLVATPNSIYQIVAPANK